MNAAWARATRAAVTERRQDDRRRVNSGGINAGQPATGTCTWRAVSRRLDATVRRRPSQADARTGALVDSRL